jgi:DNA-binding NtrC family response regulator
VQQTCERWPDALHKRENERSSAILYVRVAEQIKNLPAMFELRPTCENSTSLLIYVVDDNKDLTELYTTLLRTTGFSVRPFNKRAEALASLPKERIKPRLLITDFEGDSIPVERFIAHCLAVHPALRILMASGFHQTDRPSYGVPLNRFLQKPFTPEEFLREVRAALVSENANRTSLVSR